MNQLIRIQLFLLEKEDRAGGSEGREDFVLCRRGIAGPVSDEPTTTRGANGSLPMATVSSWAPMTNDTNNGIPLGLPRHHEVNKWPKGHFVVDLDVAHRRTPKALQVDCKPIGRSHDGILSVVRRFPLAANAPHPLSGLPLAEFSDGFL